MTMQDLLTALADFPGDAEVMVSRFRTAGTILVLPIDGVAEDAGVVHIDTSEAQGIIY